MNDLIVEIVAGLLGTGGLASIVFKHWKDWKFKRGVEKHKAGLRDIAMVYTILNKLVAALPSNRAMVIRSSNNGGIPAAGCTIKVRVLHEVFDRLDHSIRGKWDERPADDQYARLLVALAEEGYVRLVTDQMPEGELRDLYQLSGTECSEVFRLVTTPTEMIYISVNYTRKCDGHSLEDKVLIEQCLADLRTLFHKGPLT